MTLIRNLEHQAKLHRLSGANSMALLLQNAADRIGELEAHLDSEVNSSFILEGKNKDLAKEVERLTLKLAEPSKRESHLMIEVTKLRNQAKEAS